MDLYNLFVSGEKIYKQVQKSPKELNYEDYLLMIDPFFISEHDIVDVEKNYKNKNKNKNKRGGSDGTDEFGESESGESESGESESGESESGESDKGSEEGKKGKSLSDYFSGKMSEKEIQDEETNEDEKDPEKEAEEKTDRKDALKNFKDGAGSFIKYFVIMLLIGGGPLFIWFIIMYHTFKRMKSTYKWMIEPM